MSYLWQRFIHFLIAVIFLAIGIGLTVFVYSNTTSVNIDWWQLHFTNVPLGMVALVPLLLGVVLGYLYHVPSGLHDFSQSMRKSRRIGELEREKKELQHQLDRLLAMPEDGTPAAQHAAQPAAPAAPAEATPMAPVTPPTPCMRRARPWVGRWPGAASPSSRAAGRGSWRRSTRAARRPVGSRSAATSSCLTSRR